MPFTIRFLLLLILGAPVLFATPGAKQGIRDQEIDDGERVEDASPLSIAWTGLPKGKPMEMSLFHPDAYLGKFSVEDVGNGRRQICGNRNGVTKKRVSKKVGFLGLKPEQFELRDQDGFWLAKCVANNSEKGKSDGPLELDFQWEKRGILEFHGTVAPVRTVGTFDRKLVHKAPVARARVQRVGSGKRSLGLPTGRVIQWLEPGEYTVTLFAPNHVTQTKTVTIVGGEVTKVGYHLDHVPGLRNVNIEVHAGRGGYPWMESGKRERWGISIWTRLAGSHSGEWTVDFQSILLCASGREGYQPIIWEERGDQVVGLSTLYDIPPGELGFRVMCLNHAYAMSEVLEPNGDVSLVITLFRNLDGPGWGFQEIVDEKAGKRWGGFMDLKTIYAISEDRKFTRLYEFSGEQLMVPDRFAKMPERWAYCSNGHVPVFGTAADFVAKDGGWRMASLKPLAGYATELAVMDSDGKPVANAVVFADGVEVARSNALGFAKVKLSEAPKRMRVEHAHGVWRDFLWTFSPIAPFIQVRLKP